MKKTLLICLELRFRPHGMLHGCRLGVFLVNAEKKKNHSLNMKDKRKFSLGKLIGRIYNAVLHLLMSKLESPQNTSEAINL